MGRDAAAYIGGGRRADGEGDAGKALPTARGHARQLLRRVGDAEAAGGAPSRQALVGGPQLLQRQALLLRLRHRGALLPAACAVVDAVAPALAGAVGEHRAAASTAGGLLGTETADMQSRIVCNPMLGREPL